MQLGLTHRSDGRRVAAFRLDAFYLSLFSLPFLWLWLIWEGHLLDQLIHGLEYETYEYLIAAHRLTGWLLPITWGMVFAYGIARTEPDVRLASMGHRDPRRIWLVRWLSTATLFTLIAAALAVPLSLWSGESLLRLVGAATSATLFAIAIGYTISTTTGASPGVAAFATAVVVTGVASIPRLPGIPLWLAISPGPLGWMRGEPYYPVMLLHALGVTALAVAVALAAVLFPRDVRDVGWISGYRGQDA